MRCCAIRYQKETELLLLLLIRSEKILRMLRVDRKIAEHSHAIQNMPATSRDSRRPAERTRNEMRTHTHNTTDIPRRMISSERLLLSSSLAVACLWWMVDWIDACVVQPPPPDPRPLIGRNLQQRRMDFFSLEFSRRKEHTSEGGCVI